MRGYGCDRAEAMPVDSVACGHLAASHPEASLHEDISTNVNAFV